MLKRLRKLRSIDLDGNPCARCQGYRHHVVRTLPRLAEVDGERIEALDRDLADMFFKSKPLAASGSSAFGVRPSTAPVFSCDGRRRRPLGPGFRSDSGGAVATARTIQIGAEVNGGVIAEHDAKRSLASLAFPPLSRATVLRRRSCCGHQGGNTRRADSRIQAREGNGFDASRRSTAFLDRATE